MQVLHALQLCRHGEVPQYRLRVCGALPTSLKSQRDLDLCGEFCEILDAICAYSLAVICAVAEVDQISQMRHLDRAFGGSRMTKMRAVFEARATEVGAHATAFRAHFIGFRLDLIALDE